MTGLSMARIEQFGTAAGQYGTASGELTAAAAKLTTFANATDVGHMNTVPDLIKLLNDARHHAAAEIQTMAQGLQVWEGVNTQLHQLSQEHVNLSTSMLKQVITQNGGR